MTEELQKKVEKSIKLLQDGEKLALKMQPQIGYHVGFSGGKDSQVLLELVKIAGVKYRAVYNVTTIDPPENVYFIREKYPEVIFLHPKKNFYKLIEENGLPTRQRRFCCKILKEQTAPGFVVLVGVRKEESRTRAEYTNATLIKGRKKEAKEFKEMEELNFQCVNGKDRLNLNVMLDWTTKDVWEFIQERNLPINPCYQMFHRVGCMFCPFGSRKQLNYYGKKYPKIKQKIIDSQRKYMENHPNVKRQLHTAELAFKWWVSKRNVYDFIEREKQTELFEIE